MKLAEKAARRQPGVQNDAVGGRRGLGRFFLAGRKRLILRGRGVGSPIAIRGDIICGDETQIVASPFERVPASSPEAGAFSFSVALQ